MRESLSVYLSLPQLCDADSLVRLFTDDEVRKYLGGPLPLAEAKLRVKSVLHPTPGHHVWAIRANAEAVGLVWLAPHHEPPDMELSFALLPEWQGRGLAYETTSQALRFAFQTLSLPRVVSETQSANSRSIRLLNRLGMILERRLWRFGAEQSLFALTKEAVTLRD
jgi:ribosomal-protein-alanine N-acetyltransferase